MSSAISPCSYSTTNPSTTQWPLTLVRMNPFFASASTKILIKTILLVLVPPTVTTDSSIAYSTGHLALHRNLQNFFKQDSLYLRYRVSVHETSEGLDVKVNGVFPLKKPSIPRDKTQLCHPTINSLIMVLVFIRRSNGKVQYSPWPSWYPLPQENPPIVPEAPT